MNERIRALRARSLKAKPVLSAERAMLLTEFYRSGAADRVSTPVARALAFAFVLERKTISIGDGELIVGERGPVPKATPTYPEICAHTAADIDILRNREKIPFASSARTRAQLAGAVSSYWRGRSIRDLIFASVDPEWIAAYEAGVFTEFMEQRAPGHTVLDGKIYGRGFLDFKHDISASMAGLDFFNDPDALGKREELSAMSIAADALMMYARRHADAARRLARTENDRARKKELREIAGICEHVPDHAPRTFWEALQYYWFVHLGVITELNTWDSFNPGRLDQHLYPFYVRDIERGILTRERAKELLQAFWIKFNNQPAPPKVGVTAQESGTYTDFCLINIGGLTETGRDGVNELSFLILDVIEEMRLLQPSSMIQIGAQTPDRLLKRALGILKTGYGQPSIFNSDEMIKEMIRQGKNIADARNGGASGCVETGAFGKESYILTGYFNLVKVLEITLNGGVDPRTGAAIGAATGDPKDFASYEELFAAFTRQLRHFIDIKIKGNMIIERLYARHLPAPFLSILIDDCIRNGRDYNDGGARYNTSYIQGVGIGTITDCLASIKHNVFDTKRTDMKTLLSALRTDFRKHESLRERFRDDTPKYGNDDDYADAILPDVFEAFFSAVDGRPNTKRGCFRINLLPTTVHVYFGSVVGATPDGRGAGEPLSEGVSPVQGADTNGPTAVIKSAAKIDHVRTGGTLLNQKFAPQLFQSERDIENVASLVRSYFRMDGHHIQFNVVSADTLREAQKHPEKHRDLIVRVAGYSDYFVDLSKELQNEIIKRTEHGAREKC